MNHRDRGIVAALVVVLVALSIVVALGGSGPQTGVVPGASVPAGSALPSGATPDTAVYREGTIGRPSSINPLTARTQADRDLAALVFSGLVALGPDGTYRPDLAEGWTVDSTGSTWTFTIRPDATWQDGVPVTSDDVVFTVNVLKSPGYTGPLAASWRGVNATAIDERTRPVRPGHADRRLPPGGDGRPPAGAPPERGADRDPGRRSVQPPAGRLGTVRPHLVERRVGHARPGQCGEHPGG